MTACNTFVMSYIFCQLPILIILLYVCYAYNFHIKTSMPSSLMNCQ